MNAETMPKVSVAIVTYNQKEYLKEAIESVLAQHYPNLEIVVADDCSTDGTQQLLQTYRERYPEQFKLVLGNSNVGVTGNHNNALLACTGTYIAWLAGDDIMLAGRLLQQSEYMDAHPECAACFHDLDTFDSDTGQTIAHFSDTYPVKKFQQSALKTILRYGFAGGPGGMVRRSMSPSGGFDESIPCASDWLYWIELARQGSMAYFPVTLTRYRRHLTNASKSHLNLFRDLLRTIEIVDEKYPELKPDTRYAHARICYSRAIHNIRAKQWTVARQDLRESLGLSWLSWKWFLWYARALVRR